MKQTPHGAGRLRTIAPLLVVLLLQFAGTTRSAPGTEPRKTPPGRAIRLHRIDVDGLKTLSRGKVVLLTGLREGQAYSPSELEAVRDSLAEKLPFLSGLPLARVTGFQLRYGNSGRYADLLITVDEGPRAIVDSVSITGPVQESRDAILAVIRTRSGHPFDASVWNGDLERVADLLERSGHPFARVVTQPLVPAFHGDTVSVRAGMEIVPGIAVRVDRVEVAGLTRTRPSLARRVLNLPTGQRYDPAKARAARDRLLRTGWFASVATPELFRDHNGRFGLLFRVQEQQASSIDGALGYAPKVGGKGELAGNLDVRLANLLGSGRRFNLTWRRDSAYLRSFSVGFHEPYLFGSPLGLDVALAQEVLDSQYVTLDVTGGLSADLGQSWRVGGNLRRHLVSADSLASGSDSLTYSLFGVQAFVELDTRDRTLNPSHGGFYRVRTERYWPTGGDERIQLFRNGLDLEQVIPIRRGWVGFAGMHAVETRSVTGTPPLAEWSRIGGANTVRGYSERSLLAPRVGWVNLEMRRLLGADSRAFLLGDAAVLDSPGGTFWKMAYGAGVQVGTGGGVLTVAIAVPTGEGLSAAVVHAGVRATF